MSNTTPGWTPHLRYSPVNGIIVNWGFAGSPFSMACMPTPVCKGPSIVVADEPECAPLPVVEPVDTYDWFRWTPEIMAGLNDASEDMAATYARRAAIEFATKTRCLQRVIPLRLQPGVFRYPLEPFEGERVKGVLKVESAKGECSCEVRKRGLDIGHPYVHASSQEIRFRPTQGSCGHHTGHGGPEYVLVTVWVAPDEDSCAHDVLLYDEYRREVTIGARGYFMDEVFTLGTYKTQRGNANYRGDAFMANKASMLLSQFQAEIIKTKATVGSEGDLPTFTPGPLFASACRSGIRR